jgi:tetratricopeptide (TPR) repeat protein
MKKTILAFGLLLCAVGAGFATTAEEFYVAGLETFKDSDYDKAIRYFHAALLEKPDYWQAYQFMGEAYYQSGNRTEALVAMNESLRLHPENPELRRFASKVEASSPWVPSGPFSVREKLPLISIILSLATLAWVSYWVYWLRPSEIITFLLNFAEQESGGHVSQVAVDFTVFNSGSRPAQVAGYRVRKAGNKAWEPWKYFEPATLLSATDSRKILNLVFNRAHEKLEGLEFGDGAYKRWALNRTQIRVLNEVIQSIGKPKKDLPKSVLG